MMLVGGADCTHVGTKKIPIKAKKNAVFVLINDVERYWVLVRRGRGTIDRILFPQLLELGHNGSNFGIGFDHRRV